MPPFITFEKVIPRIPSNPFSQPIDWQINKGEIWAVVGKNGCGKSQLAQIIRGQYIIDSGKLGYHFIQSNKQHDSINLLSKIEQYIKIINADTTYSIADYRQAYYQQRFNNSDVENIPFVYELFHPENYESELIEQIIDIFELDKLMNCRLIHLSSGELRKFIIARVILQRPRMMIFDNPFAGLDVKSRNNLNDIFLELNQLGIQLLFLVPSYADMPEYTTHILEIENGKVIPKGKVQTQISNGFAGYIDELFLINWKNIPSVSDGKFEFAVKMDNVDIGYGTEKVCSSINWTIKKGEKWALLGSNGSGKSTLLSCIFADNPVSYAKNIVLFDRKRGTGESIWEIKQHIGFTSSELHLYYRRNISGLEIVESGFFDSIGLHKQCTAKQTAVAQYLINLLLLEHLSDRPFLRMSSGEQRMLLFLRSLVKNPDLLILDEPYHGLDDMNKEQCMRLVDSYCTQAGKTLIYVTHNREEIPKSVDKILELS
jgi:molybdate transport system ATP-binding protein